MNRATFCLVPFAPLAASFAGIRLSGTAERRAGELAIRFRLHDPAGLLLVPPPAPRPSRQHGLWEATCFEFFLAPAGEDGYWECNLAPSGDWNLFVFNGYRAGMAEEKKIGQLPFAVQQGENGLAIEVELDLRPLLAAGIPLALGLSAVLLDQKGEKSYWALAHTSNRPDFHDRRSFLLTL